MAKRKSDLKKSGKTAGSVQKETISSPGIQAGEPDAWFLRVDQKNRITLSGLIPEGISSMRATVDSEHRIILEPYIEIPAREAWLFQNPEALAMVRKGLKQSAKGKTVNLGSFSAFADDDSED